MFLLLFGCAPPAAGPAWERVPTEADLPTDRPLLAGFLIVDGVFNSELMAPYDILQHTVFHTGDRPAIEVCTISPDGELVTSFEGIRILPDYGFHNAPRLDILVVPSAEGSMDRDLENQELLQWVRKTGDGASYVMSLCDGAFVLAAAGQLDGRSCTTFPGDQDRFAETFPELNLRRDVSFVHDGKTMTSQGGAKSYDVAMYLVDHLYGEKVAAGVGGGLIIPWPPSPGSMPAVVVVPGAGG
ncbi:MAG: DJ-1/PfpI family protein [Acidobacteria bacterium]|uniref:DJ-1/PfpI family protein n=1 Tax=Candidatus Polarisedimenticola svalbardensis TaxID=2886004 RepID=A0A8J6Y278_9BACT|nr:DJ-1/PfpI family protein [Candidatus Polarisedimenticola svalbardensis]